MPTPTSSAPTLEAVALAAGVSRSTVSRVVNGSPKVAPDVRTTVERAIAELGYVPNHAARSLASRRSHSIALIVPEDTRRFFTDPYFADVIEGVNAHLANTPYTLTLLMETEADASRTTRYLQSGSVDGVLIVSTHRGDRSYAGLNIPVVFSGRPMNPHDGAVIVDVDNVDAGRLATSVLVARGRRRIVTIAGPQDMGAGQDRLAGWRAALAAAGIEPGPIEYGDFTPASGAAAAERLLASGYAFDGIFIASAQMAHAALEVFAARGVAVPAEVSATTVDDDRFAATSQPPLTTIAQPTRDQGAKIADVLVGLIEGRAVDPITIMPTMLVERESV